MGKSFLDTLDDAFEDHVLSDLIPDTRKAPASRSLPVASKKSGSRKKSFLHTIEDSISDIAPKRTSSTAAAPKSSRKSFLETIEEAYDQSAFDDLMPSKGWSKKDIDTFSPDKEFERKFGAYFTPAVMNKVKEIARGRGIRLQDVILRALELYLNTETT